ncbi:MAG: 23S rRNA (pseudouridine(1915)-N(3))-methyltransferase RlmH [Proteobacteria bacterium]|nr:23S rRNA (pseudouridine(1915)-N(3))-methyltransferase RlmH [Pseudomonadota bacterium]MBU1739868.1 23S rRNA (pseudouridine(1915)-N(3))-methyltransferase RlmH [Pseudomonadota bacterium]
MKFDLIFLGRTKAQYLTDGIDDFLARLKHYAEVQTRTLKVKEPGKKPEAQIKDEEADILLSHLEPGTTVVALDPGGRQYSSEEFAEKIAFWEDTGRSHISILIGGPLGLSGKVLARADQVMSLSRMTFTHDMTRLIVLEQLYRALNIRKGTGYHK